MEAGSTFKSIYVEEVYSVPTPVTVVLSNPWDEVKEEQRLLLSKILAFIRHSLDSVRIIHTNQLDLSTWMEKPRQIIAFTQPSKGLSAYEVIQTGETSVVFSDSLETLISNEEAKRKLVGALKAQFSL